MPSVRLAFRLYPPGRFLGPALRGGAVSGPPSTTPGRKSPRVSPTAGDGPRVGVAATFPGIDPRGSTEKPSARGARSSVDCRPPAHLPETCAYYGQCPKPTHMNVPA